MQKHTLWMIVGLLIASLALSACGGSPATTVAAEKPYKLDKMDGSDLNLVTLTQATVDRLKLETGKISEQQLAGAKRLVVPYSALIYGLHGENWIYISPQPLSFHRAEVKVDYIEGDQVILIEGPAVGTAVATKAVAQLYGLDTGVKK